MNTTSDPPDLALWVLVLAGLALEALAIALRPLLAHAIALVLAAIPWRPAAAGAPIGTDALQVLALDATPAPVQVKQRRRTRTARKTAA